MPSERPTVIQNWKRLADAMEARGEEPSSRVLGPMLVADALGEVIEALGEDRPGAYEVWHAIWAELKEKGIEPGARVVGPMLIADFLYLLRDGLRTSLASEET